MTKTPILFSYPNSTERWFATSAYPAIAVDLLPSFIQHDFDSHQVFTTHSAPVEGTEFNQITRILPEKSEMYEYSNILAKWARDNGYNGLIVPGARGTKNYENVIVFDQSYVNQVLQGKTAIKISK